MMDFVERHDLTDVPQVADTDGAVWRRFGIVGQPSWVFVDGETGRVSTHFGVLDEAGLRAELDALTG